MASISLNLALKDPKGVRVGQQDMYIKHKVHQGNYCDLYFAGVDVPLIGPVVRRSKYDLFMDSEEYVEQQRPLVFKIARTLLDTDYVDQEVRTLCQLQLGKEVTNPIIPQYLGRVLVNNKLGFFQEYAQGYRTLLEVSKNPLDGLLTSDLSWVRKGLLEGLAIAHAKGFIHGGILPKHVLINLETQTVKLVDWSHAVNKGPILKIDHKQLSMYPTEVMDRKKATPKTDLFMLDLTLRSCLGPTA